MILKYRKEWSEPQSLPGGTVQGSLLGMILFVIELSDAGMPVPPQAGSQDVISVQDPLPSVTENEVRLKYIDDHTQGEVIKLKSALKLNADMNGPRDYLDRHGHVLPLENSLVQTRLNDIQEYARIHQLKINRSKTKIMSFNFSTKYSFLPKLFYDNEQLDVVKSFKLLGVIISSDLKWNEHTAYIVKKGKQRLWRIRRLMCLGASRETLLNQFKLLIRSIFETSAPVFAGGLTKSNSSDIEAVQKAALKIILRNDYNDYEQALELVEELTLEERREINSLKFAKKSSAHPKLKQYFQKRDNAKTRSKPTYFESKSYRARGEKNPIKYLIRLLNDNLPPEPEKEHVSL